MIFKLKFGINKIEIIDFKFEQKAEFLGSYR